MHKQNNGALKGTDKRQLDSAGDKDKQIKPTRLFGIYNKEEGVGGGGERKQQQEMENETKKKLKRLRRQKII